MSGSPSVDRRTRRRQETRAEIVAAAWGQVREHGLAGLSMRDLGQRVGMRAQSLYSYFASKHEIYDAMFLEGNEAFVRSLRALPPSDDPAEIARDGAHNFFEFCVSDPVRYQLLFQRTLPDFVPSERSYDVAREAYQLSVDQLHAMGVTQSGIDLWTAVLAGLVAQQLSNEPGGDRWAVLIDDAVDMLLAAVLPETFNSPTFNNRTVRSNP
jgi:AcrR family transcriptional regulator